MTYLFGRRVVVTIDELRVEGLTTKFTVRHQSDGFGKAQIEIYNLNSTHRQDIETYDDKLVTLEVGYQDTTLDQIFKGVIRRGYTKKIPQNYITTLETGDGDKAQKVRMNRAYQPKTPKRLVWSDLVTALKDAGIGAGNAIAKFDLAEFQDNMEEFLSGAAVQGSVLKEIKRMARAAKLDIQIQDQELVVTALDEPLEETAVVLAPGSGLVGEPEKGTKGEIKVKALIIPGLRPKRLIQLDSRRYQGVYVIKSTKYKGDSRGNEWYAYLECVER